MCQDLTDPVNVAKLLHKENVLSEEVVLYIETKPSLQEKRKVLLLSIQDAVCRNYCSLEIFGKVLDNVTSSTNESLAGDLLNEYSK